MMLSRVLWVCLLSFAAIAGGRVTAAEPLTVPLWVDGAPGTDGRRVEPERPEPGHDEDGWITNVHNPSLTVYLPAAANASGAAVVVAPGGAHRFLAVEHEGHAVGQWLAEHGVAGCVLKYRLHRQQGSPYDRDDTIADGERAIRLVRSRADEWHIQPDRIGLLGFSAGGDVVLATSGASDPGEASAADPIDRVSSRPDFQVPIYAGGLDRNPPAISGDTPPTLIICATDDAFATGSADLFLAVRKAGVPVELHLYGSGGHGFGLRPGRRAVDKWPERLVDWMRDIRMLDN